MRNSTPSRAVVGFLLLVLASQTGAAGPQETKRSYKPLPPPANFSPPVMEIDNPDFDWGTTLQGEKVRHDYVITNKGGSPLIISQVRASCGCTMAAKPQKPIAPGNSDVVTLEINTKRFTGKIKKTAQIYSNAQPSPVTISIGGVVETFYTLEPANPRINIVRGAPTEPVKLTLRRKADTTLQFRVKEISTESKILTTSISELQPGQLYEITLAADIGQEARKYFYERAKLVLEVNQRVVDVDLNVSVTVKERIDVQPRTSIYFSRNDTKALSQPGSKPVSKSLEIVSLGGSEHRFQITGVSTEKSTTPTATASSSPGVPSADKSCFDTKIETVEPGKHYRLIVLMNQLPSQKVRTVRERIVLQTDDPTVGELKVTAMAAVY